MFSGLTFSLQLSCDSKQKQQIVKCIKDHGGEIAFSVSKKTTHLVTNEDTCSDSFVIRSAHKAGCWIVLPSFVQDSISRCRKANELQHCLVDGQIASTIVGDDYVAFVARRLRQALTNVVVPVYAAAGVLHSSTRSTARTSPASASTATSRASPPLRPSLQALRAPLRAPALSRPGSDTMLTWDGVLNQAVDNVRSVCLGVIAARCSPAPFAGLPLADLARRMHAVLASRSPSRQESVASVPHPSTARAVPASVSTTTTAARSSPRLRSQQQTVSARDVAAAVPASTPPSAARYTPRPPPATERRSSHPSGTVTLLHLPRASAFCERIRVKRAERLRLAEAAEHERLQRELGRLEREQQELQRQQTLELERLQRQQEQPRLQHQERLNEEAAETCAPPAPGAVLPLEGATVARGPAGRSGATVAGREPQRQFDSGQDGGGDVDDDQDEAAERRRRTEDEALHKAKVAAKVKRKLQHRARVLQRKKEYLVAKANRLQERRKQRTDRERLKAEEREKVAQAKELARVEYNARHAAKREREATAGIDAVARAAAKREQEELNDPDKRKLFIMLLGSRGRVLLFWNDRVVQGGLDWSDIASLPNKLFDAAQKNSIFEQRKRLLFEMLASFGELESRREFISQRQHAFVVYKSKHASAKALKTLSSYEERKNIVRELKKKLLDSGKPAVWSFSAHFYVREVKTKNVPVPLKRKAKSNAAPPPDSSSSAPGARDAPESAADEAFVSRSTLSAAQTEQYGSALYPLVFERQPELAGKITGMILDGCDAPELDSLLAEPLLLSAKIREALDVWHEHTKTTIAVAAPPVHVPIVPPPSRGAASAPGIIEPLQRQQQHRYRSPSPTSRGGGRGSRSRGGHRGRSAAPT